MERMAYFLVFVIAVEVVTGWGCDLVVRHLSILCDALGSIPSTEKQKKKSKQSKKKKEKCDRKLSILCELTLLKI